MAQHDQVIDNGPGLAVRTDINAALAALFSSSSGTVEPAVRVAGQLWFNTTTGQLQLRNAANTAWTSLTGTLGGTVTVTPVPLTFQGTSTGVGAALVSVRDSFTTTGAAGNPVLAVNRQNSATHSLMIGNDGNGAALIGGNNNAMRFGNWASGIFTERMNMSAAGVWTFAGTQQVIIGGTPGIEVVGATANIKLTDNTASAYDFWMHVDGNQWYVLVDRTATGTWDTPHPLQLNASTNIGSLFGSQILTVGNYDALGVTPEARQVIAGNGLTGGGDLTANRTLTLGTPGTITNSTTNSVTATSHTHALGGTVVLVYTGSLATETVFPLGHIIMADDTAAIARNAAIGTVRLATDTSLYVESGAGTELSGTWRARGAFTSNGRGTILQRAA